MRGAVWMLLSVAIQGITGLVFWALAAHWYIPTDVGIASALFSSVLLVIFMTGMGLVVTVPLYAFASDRESATLLTWAFLVTIATSCLGTAIFLGFVPSDAAHLLNETMGAWGWVLFAFVSAGASLATLTDIRLMTERRWGWVLGRNGLVGFGRIFLLFLPAIGTRSLWLFAMGALPAGVSGFVAAAAIPSICKLRYRLRPLPARVGQAVRFAGVNWFGIIVSQGPSFVVPVLVSLHVTPSENAHFFLAWSAASLVFVIPTTMSQVLLAESPKRDQKIRTKALEALALSLTLVALAVVASLAIRGVILSVYGADYRQIADLLPLLMAAGLPWAFTAIGLTIARIRRDQFIVLTTTISAGIALLILTVVLVDRHGVVGAATGWLLGNAFAAVVMVLASVVSARVRRRPNPPAIFGRSLDDPRHDIGPVEELVVVGEAGVTVLGGDQRSEDDPVENG